MTSLPALVFASANRLELELQRGGQLGGRVAEPEHIPHRGHALCQLSSLPKKKNVCLFLLGFLSGSLSVQKSVTINGELTVGCQARITIT